MLLSSVRRVLAFQTLDEDAPDSHILVSFRNMSELFKDAVFTPAVDAEALLLRLEVNCLMRKTEKCCESFFTPV